MVGVPASGGPGTICPTCTGGEVVVAIDARTGAATLPPGAASVSALAAAASSACACGSLIATGTRSSYTTVATPARITRPTTSVTTADASGNATLTAFAATRFVEVVVVAPLPSLPPAGHGGPRVPLNGPATASGATPLLALTEKLYDCDGEVGAPYSSPLAGSRCIPVGNAPDETEYVGTGLPFAANAYPI